MWSNKKIYRDELICEKSCNSRMVDFGVSSGTTDATSWQSTQQLYFNNVQPLGSKGARNFWLNGEFDIIYNAQVSDYTTCKTYLEFVKNPLWAMSCLVSINGGVNQEVLLGVVDAIYENYTDKYKAFPDRKTQNYYDTYLTPEETYTANNTAEDKTAKIKFSVPLMHPFLMQPIGQVSSLNIRIGTTPGFYNLFNVKSTGAGTPTFNSVHVSISNLHLTYEEFDMADEDFSNEFEYMVIYPKKYGNGASDMTVSSDVRNISSVPHDLFCMVERDGMQYSIPVSTNKPRTMQITNLYIDLQNNMNAFNITGITETKTIGGVSKTYINGSQSIYSRCRANDYKGAFSDWADSSDNSFSAVIRYPMRDAPVDIGTNDMFRADFREVCIPYKSANDQATLYVIYSYKAIMHLSLKGGINAVEYTKNSSEAFMGEITDGKEDDYIGGFSFSNLLNKAGKWIKNGGISKIINTAGAVSDIIKPGNKVSQGLDKAGQIASAVGLSSSIF